MGTFALFQLNDSSVLLFHQQMQGRWENLQRIYGIGSVSGDMAMRQALVGANPTTVGKLFNSALKVHKENRLWKRRKVW